MNSLNLDFQKTFQRYLEKNKIDIIFLNFEHVLFNILKLNRDLNYEFFKQYFTSKTNYINAKLLEQEMLKELDAVKII